VVRGLEPPHRALAEELFAERVGVHVDPLRLEELDDVFRERVVGEGRRVG
jgi:hypothetical protein